GWGGGGGQGQGNYRAGEKLDEFPPPHGICSLAENHRRQSLIRSSSESYALHCSKKGALMSAMGQKRTSSEGKGMSALPLKADIAESELECPPCANCEHQDFDTPSLTASITRKVAMVPSASPFSKSCPVTAIVFVTCARHKTFLLEARANAYSAAASISTANIP